MRYNPSLDGLRAVAVIMVMLVHGSGRFKFGYSGVDIFFVLSGFLITSTLLAEQTETGRISFSNFYVRRALRLLPALLALCAVFAMWCLATGQPASRFQEILLALTFIGNWQRDQFQNIGHVWSLGVEEQYYLIWPMLFILLLRVSSGVRIAALVSAIAICGGYKFALLVSGVSFDHLYNGTDTRIDEFLAGGLLAFALTASPDTVAKIGRLWPYAIVLFAAIVLPGYGATYLYAGGLTVMALCVSVVIADLCANAQSPLSKALRNDVLVWIGRRSYGIYLWHGFIASVLPRHHWWFWSVYVATTAVASWASFRFIEQPFLKLKPALKISPTQFSGQIPTAQHSPTSVRSSPVAAQRE